VVNCATGQEVEEPWEKLLEGGEKVEFGRRKDKIWRIVANRSHGHKRDVANKDAERSRKVMKAMLQLQMKKLGVAC